MSVPKIMEKKTKDKERIYIAHLHPSYTTLKKRSRRKIKNKKSKNERRESVYR